jgi:hypothetical protein
MNVPADSEPAPDSDPLLATRAVIDRRLLDEIFGDVLPDTTSDEREPGGSDGAGSEEWYRANRPPHHGG